MRVLQTLYAFSGNAPPQLAVTHALVARGHSVRVLGHRAARSRIENTGAEFVEIERALPDLDLSHPETDPVRDWEARTRLGAAKRLRDRAMVEPLADHTAECLDLLESWPADVVVFDWLLQGAAIAAERVGVPAAALIHCPFPLPLKGAPPLGTALRPMAGPVGRARDQALGRLARRFADAGLPVMNQTRAEHGLEPLEHWNDQLLALDAIFVMTAPELDYASRGALPPNVHYVGPAFEPFDREWSSPWPPSNDDPLVLISFSSSYMDQRGLAQRVLDAVGELRVRALLTAGPAIDPAELRIPPNTRAVAFVPHRAVLPQAALVVTHAGWQTVNAALADGVPLVCIPDARDQPDNAARVVEAGVGIRVRKNTTPRKLRGVIERALREPALKRNATSMAGALAGSDGAVTISQQLERLARTDTGARREATNH